MTIAHKLAALSTLSPAQLCGEWLQLYGKSAPPYSHQLLTLGLAYKMQEQWHGGLAPNHQKLLDRLMKQDGDERRTPMNLANAYMPGTHLLREWRGKTYRVVIQDEGYIYGDRTYRSLSQIAKEITGTSWSGPRFFGLVERKGKGDGAA
ncbi:DUF2924 domain-containing protein [Sphingobium phenoxybenzoativorans]|uniref:DUF2924 domain-containing protein n=1 Tax=Sphingobium phenoxybenzoativorans TaxID=1592790 RepID=UPI0008720B50|nr:DUF2924 domain-containing protein [Sphingobium phenoxybenzoativorans]